MDIIKRIFNYSKRHRGKALFAISCLILNIGINLTTPRISKIIVDDVIKGGMRDLLLPLLLILFAAGLVKSIIIYLRGLYFEKFSQDTLYELRNDMYSHLQGLPYSYYDKNRVGELMSRMTGDLEGIRNFLAIGISTLLENGIYLIGTTATLLILNFKLGIATMAVTPFIAYLAYRFNKVVRPIFTDIREQHAVLNTAAQENITGVRVVKAFAREEYEIEKFERENYKNKQKNIVASRAWAKYFPLMDFLSSICLVVVIWYGGSLVARGQATVGDIVAFNAYLWMLIMPMRLLGWMINLTAQATTSGQRVFEVLDTGSSIKEKDNPYIPDQYRGEVVFYHVNFSYRKQAVLKDIDFVAPAGSTIAIMGETGSGKTSLINLIGRFYDTCSGQVMVDGINVRNWSLRDLRSQIGIIMQETFLFSDTIEGNIQFGNPDASKEEIIRAAQIADAHDFIMEMPQGYDTIIGERGMGLSGGQKQRIAIARAIVKNPKILIMDDCTSAVDMETEYEIQKALKTVMENRTTFIIAHRVSSVKNADTILFLEEGRIVERGDHDSLMAQRGRYYEMVRQQYKDLDSPEFKGQVI